jgi:hypothetical protein
MSNWCQCSSSEIKKGDGYIYISQKVVAFRKDACSLRAFTKKLGKMSNNKINVTQKEYEPIIICKKAAQLYNLDLTVSSEDAEFWWKMQKVPLRVTPKVQKIRKKRKLSLFTIVKQNKFRTGTETPIENSLNYRHSYRINENENHSDPISLNKTFRLSKEQMNILSSADITSHATGMHLEEMADNIIDEKEVRTYGRNFIILSDSKPGYIIRNNGMNRNSMTPELSYHLNNPVKESSHLNYFLSLIKWLLPIKFSIWLFISAGTTF